MIALPLLVWLLNLQADPVETDAQAYTQFVMQHDRLLFQINLQRVPPSEEARLPAIRSQGDLIKKKYTRGGPHAKLAARFDARIKELSAQVVAPAVKSWVVEAFPEVDAVRAAYPEPARMRAALLVLRQTLAEKVGQPLTPAAAAKLERYRVALPPRDPDGPALDEDLAFQADVLRRFLPVYAVETENRLRKRQFEQRKRDDETRIWRAYQGVGLAVLAVPLVYLLIGRRGGRRAPPPDLDAAFRLPEEQRRIRVFRQAYDVEIESGRVSAAESWTETVTTQIYTPGSSYYVGDTFHHSAGSWGTRTRTTSYLRFTLESPDGRSTTRTLTGWGPEFQEGQFLSLLTCGSRILMYGRHGGPAPFPLSTVLDALHRVPGRWLWLASVLVAYFGLDAVQRRIVKGGEYEGDYRFGYMVASLTLLTALVSPVYLWIWKSFVQKRRNRQFHERYAPGLKQALVEQGPLLEKHFRTRRPA